MLQTLSQGLERHLLKSADPQVPSRANYRAKPL